MIINNEEELQIMIKIFDTHAHYDDEAFDSDRDTLIKELPKHGIMAAANIGVDIETSRITAELTGKYDNIYGVVGIYPSNSKELEKSETIDELRNIITSNEKVVALGEIGLDYHYEDTDKELQHRCFATQMNLAKELKVPIVVHSRDAAKDTVDIMTAEGAGNIGGVIHCYSYTKELARDFLNMGFYFGIGGVITFKNARKLKAAVEYIPLENIVLETDSPYLTPSPHRGERNSSLYLPLVAQEIARIKGVDVEAVYEATWINAHRLYNISINA